MDLGKITRSHSRLADEVYDRLLSALASGSIQPGDRLVQDKLADQLDVSRTPVREALLRLEKEGTIKAAQRRGFVVTTVGRDELVQLYRAREAVEAYAARLVAEDGGAALDDIERAVAEVSRVEPKSIEQLYEANRLIHRSIVQATGNQFLIDMFDSLWGRQMALRAVGELFLSRTDHADMVAGHADLLHHLRGDSGDEAQAAMVRHIREGLHLHEGSLTPE